MRVAGIDRVSVIAESGTDQDATVASQRLRALAYPVGCNGSFPSDVQTSNANLEGDRS